MGSIPPPYPTLTDTTWVVRYQVSFYLPFHTRRFVPICHFSRFVRSFAAILPLFNLSTAPLLHPFISPTITHQQHFSSSQMALGATVRFLGNGHEKRFGITGALLVAIGCVIGKLFSTIALLPNQLNMTFSEMNTQFDIINIIQIGFDMIRLTFLAWWIISIVIGYRLSYRSFKDQPML